MAAGSGFTLRVNMVLNAAGFVAGMAAAKASAIRTSAVMSNAVGLGAVGIALGMAKATKAAIDWEDSMAGVRRTIDLTESQQEHSSEIYGQIEQDLRDLTKVIPIAHDEMAQMAETAGAIGVPAEAIKDFVRVAGTLSKLSDDLDPAEIASSMGKIRTVMGLATEDFDRFGSAVVQLGISGASTENEIIQMAKRASGAFGTLGISVPNLLAWSAAMSNVDEKSEAGGTTLQRLGLIIQKSVAAQGPLLDATAKSANMTSEAFTTLFKGDASAAMFKFIEGLSGLDTFERLDALRDSGFKDIRLQRGLTKIVAALGTGNEGNLADALSDSAKGWSEETAMAEMAAERWDTVSKKWDILGNKVQDFAITLGTTLIPVVEQLVDWASSLVDGLAELARAFPGITKFVTPIVTALSAILALRFGLKMMASMLPLGGAGKLMAAQWGLVATAASSAIMRPITALAGLIPRAMAGFISIMGITGTAAGTAFGIAWKLAALGLIGLAIIVIEKELEMLGNVLADIEKGKAKVAEGVKVHDDFLASMPSREAAVAELADLQAQEKVAWDGMWHGVKFFTDIIIPEESHAFDTRIANVQAYIENYEDLSRQQADAQRMQAYNDQLAVQRGADALAALANMPVKPMRTLGDLFRPTEEQLMEGFRKLRMTIGAGRAEVATSIQSFWEGLAQALKEPPVKIMKPGQRLKEMDRIIGGFSMKLKQAIRAKDKLAIEYYAGTIIQAKQQRKEFVNSAAMTAEDTSKLFKSLGQKVPKFLQKMVSGAKSKGKATENAAKTTRTNVETVFTANPDALFAPGAALINGLARGMTSQQGIAAEAAREVAHAISLPFVGNSPPVMGPLKNIDKDGANIVTTFAGGMMGKRHLAAATGRAIAGAVAPAFGVRGSLNAARAGGGGGGRGDTLQVGTLIATDSGLDELDRRMGRRKQRRSRARRLLNDPN